MTLRPFEHARLLAVREMLEIVLQRLDEAELQRVAVHVDMALVVLGKEQACQPIGFADTGFS